MKKSETSEISCPICLEIYDLPKVLACGHSFCETCILPLIRKGRLECPECRGVMVVPPNGLVTNFAMNGLVKSMSRVNMVTIVSDYNMSEEMISMAKRVAWKAINNDQQSTDAIVAWEISTKFKTKYGGNWQCIVSEHFNCNLITKEYICLKVDNKKISLFKARPDKTCWKCDGVSFDGHNCKLGQLEVDEKFSGRNKNDQMIEEAKRVAVQAIKEETSPKGAAKFVKDYFDKKYGVYWQCIITKMGGTDFHCKTGSHVRIKIGSLDIQIFKTSQIAD